MDAVALALGSAFLFGAMTVTLRDALRRGVSAESTAFLMVLIAFGVALAAIPLTGAGGLTSCWPFLLAGLVAPGLSQVLFAYAVRDAGPARASVAVGMAPLVSVAIAFTLLGEPVKPLLLAGALATMVLFASRDSLIRRLSIDTDIEPAVAAAATLGSGTAVLLLFLVLRGRRVSLRPIAAVLPTGLAYGLSYVLLFEAFYRGRVSVVSPLVATESLWTVVLALVFLRRHEHVGARLVLGALLVVAGGVLIGVFR